MSRIPKQKPHATPATSQTIISANPTRIMPLGDSITDGYNIPGGYRIELWKKFVANNLNINFVGSLFNGPAELGDPHHEGHSGWRIDEITAKVNDWLGTYQPKIILLLIGTNDIEQNFDVPNAPNRLSALVDQIFSRIPDATILVASIPPINDPKLNPQVNTYNATIQGMVNQKISQGKKAVFVDVYSVITFKDIPDTVHPTLEGYNKIAQAWFDKLLPLLQPSNSPTPTPTGTLLPEDIDHDGCVGLLDFNVWYKAIKGTLVTNTSPDINKDGIVDLVDFNLWFKGMKSLPPEKLC